MENQTFPSFPKGLFHYFHFCVFRYLYFRARNTVQRKVGRVQTFAGIFVARQRFTIRFVPSISRSLYTDRRTRCYLILRKRGERGGKTDAARKFCSSANRNDAVKPVEDKQAYRIEVYQTTRVIECCPSVINCLNIPTINSNCKRGSLYPDSRRWVELECQAAVII